MRVLRLAPILLVGAAYVSGSVLVGSLLGGKTHPTANFPDGAARLARMKARMATEDQRQWPTVWYNPGDYQSLLEEHPPDRYFSTESDFIDKVANRTCRFYRVSVDEPNKAPEVLDNGKCGVGPSVLPSVNSEKRFEFAAIYLCTANVEGSYIANYEKMLLIFPDVDHCIDAVAQAMDWKGIYLLKQACVNESAAALKDFSGETEQKLVRKCVVKNLQRRDDRIRQIAR